ncbi:MAG: sialidase family protein [Candidatus Aenigmatarchaeota archaeon]
MELLLLALDESGVMRKKWLAFIFFVLFFISIKNVLAAWCCLGSGGSCTCSSTGSCTYTCNPGWFNDDGIVTNGCENQAPKWFTPSENSTNPNPGDAVKFSVNWTDVVGAAGKGLGINYTWFSWNASGVNCDTWVNISFTPRNNVNSIWHNETQIIPTACAGKKIVWKQYANDSAGEINVSQERIIAVQDIQPPQYSLNSTNSTVAGSVVQHSLKWTDDVGLSYAIFSFDNCTGRLQNISGMSLSGTEAWSNFSVVINSTVGCTIRWCVYVNDTNNNWNGSSCQNPFSYTTTPYFPTTTTVPFSPNQRAICRDGKNYIHIVWKYDANTISYARSIDNGKTWIINNTIVNSTGSKGLPSISCDGNNITIAYRNGTSGVVIYISENNGESFEEKVPYSSGIGEYVSVERRGQRIYVVYQDNEDATDIEFFNSSDAGNTWGPIKVVFDGYETYVGQILQFAFYYYEPSIAVDGNGSSNDRIHIVAREKSYDTGILYYFITYKNSSNSGVSWSPYRNVIFSDQTEFFTPSITYNGSKVYVTYYSSDNKIYFNSSSDYGSTWTGERIDTIIDTSKARYPSVTTNSLGYPLVLWQQNDTTNNKRWNIIYRNNSGSWENPVWITTDIAGDNVYPNSKYQSKDCVEFIYRKGTSSPYNIIYNNLTVCPFPSPPYLEAWLSSPPLSYNVPQNSTFIINATVYCKAGSCGNVYGTVRYNASSPFPDTPISTTEGDKPFFIQEAFALATKACPTNPLDENEFCNLTWVVNASGDVNSVWKIGVLFNSSLTEVQQNHTQNSTITIVSGIEIESLILSWDFIDFGFLTPSTPAENNPAPGNENNLYNITVIGACSPNIWIKGTDLTNSTYNSFIAVGNLSWSNSSNIYNPSTVYPLDYYYKLLYSALPPNSNLTLYYWLSVPSVYAGIYKGTITICGNCSSLCD